MRLTSLSLLSLISALAARAAPFDELEGLQAVLADQHGFSPLASGIFGGVVDGAEKAAADARKAATGAKEAVERWAQGGREFVKQNGLTCMFLLGPPMGRRLIATAPRQTNC